MKPQLYLRFNWPSSILYLEKKNKNIIVIPSAGSGVNDVLVPEKLTIPKHKNR